MSITDKAREAARKELTSQCGPRSETVEVGYHVQQLLTSEVERLTKERDEAANKVSELSTKVASTHRLYEMAFDNQTRWMDRHSESQKALNRAQSECEALRTRAEQAERDDLRNLVSESPGDALAARLATALDDKLEAEAELATLRTRLDTMARALERLIKQCDDTDWMGVAGEMDAALDNARATLAEPKADTQPESDG